MAKRHRYIATAGLALLCGVCAHARPVLLEIEGGETAFVVDRERERAAWVLDSCHRPIPIDSSTARGMESSTLSDSVQLGARQVELRQRFRFTLGERAGEGASVDVFNSVRGGWTPVPVRVHETCASDPACRARMELPECSADF